jgi:hypothetical protein
MNNVFKMLAVVFGVSLAGLALAQSQAPVTWGEARSLGIGNVPYTLHPTALMGDTLVFAGILPNQDTPPHYCPAVIYSHDNGLTFGTWQCLDSSIYSIGLSRLFVSGSGGLVFAFTNGLLGNPPQGHSRILRSLDAGMLWTLNLPQAADTGTRCGFVSGQQVVRIYGFMESDSTFAEEAAISDDSGDNWHIVTALDIPQSVEVQGVAFTQSHILLLASRVVNNALRLATTSGERAGQNWTDFSLVPHQPLGNHGTVGVVADTLSETVFVTEIAGGASEWVAHLYANRTTDGGRSWEPPRNLTDGHPLDRITATPQLFSRGKLWGVVWEDYWNPDPSQWGVYSRLSANHGKDWYPAQPLGLDVPGMFNSSGQFVGNEMRLYWIDYGHDYATATGILTPDTLAPIITLNPLGTDTIHAYDTLRFEATVTDNDTLSQVKLHITDSTAQETIIALSRVGQTNWAGLFQVPHEGLFRYKGEAEDFWENVAVYPDTGWLSFHAEVWSKADPLFIVPRSSFIVSVYPNPSNVWPSVQL